nr:polysaccharide deacetylase family protein [Streptomyces oceani]
MAAYERWGLDEPLPARPEPPGVKDRARGAEVVSRVPTDDKVIFLTVDDGAEQDPEFLRLVRELDLPVSSFLTDQEVRGPGGAGYGYFRELERFGGSTHNHTLRHPYLPALDRDRQRREICGQQDVLKEKMGGPEPRLFRPPYGAYDGNTLRAARECGIDAVVLWGMEAWADRIEFQRPGKQLYPGAIILTHFRGPAEWGGTMADMTRRLLRLAAEQGYTVARLEDYL